MTPNVLDLSHHNSPAVPNFAALKARGILAVILKATQGTKMVDETFAPRVAACAEADMLVGAYHFMDASDAHAQAAHFQAVVAGATSAKMLMAADYEPNNGRGQGGTASLRQLVDFMTAIDQDVGVSCVVYSSNLIRETLVPHPGGHQDAVMTDYASFFRSHRLWLAEYGPHERIPWPWNVDIRDKENNVSDKAPGAWLWQFAETQVGLFGGILAGKVDCNLYTGTAAQLAANWV